MHKQPLLNPEIRALDLPHAHILIPKGVTEERVREIVHEEIACACEGISQTLPTSKPITAVAKKAM